jgi:hypothetical protein
MEWAFLTCHKCWIALPLVRDDGDHPYLAYLLEIGLKDSSEPFQDFLSSILSVFTNIPVKPSASSSDMESVAIEEEDNDPLPEDDIYDN